MLFGVQAVALVFSMPFTTPPDEQNNISFIQYYSTHSVGPIFDHQTPTYYLGDKTREVDYLYHYSMSLLKRVLPFSDTVELYIMRMLTVLTALLAFIAFAALWRHLGVKDGAINTGLLVLTNLPMVLMLSAAINNDAMVWLLVGVSGVLVVRLLKNVRRIDMLLLANVVVIGGLIKRTFLPLAALGGFFLLYLLVRHWRSLVGQLRKYNTAVVALLLVFLVGAGLFTERIGGNISHYGTIQPSCEMVQGEVPCKVFWASVRRDVLLKQPSGEQKNLIEFSHAWLQESVTNVFDVQTQFWRHEVMPPKWVTPFMLTILFVGLGYGVWRETRSTNADKKMARWRLAAIAVGVYVFIYQLITNYIIFQNYKVFGLALNGRYILPGAILLTGLCCYYWGNLLSKKLAFVLASTVVVLTIACTGITMMIRNPQLFGL